MKRVQVLIATLFSIQLVWGTAGKMANSTSRVQEVELFSAVKQSNLSKVRKLIEVDKVNPNIKESSTGNTLLHQVVKAAAYLVDGNKWQIQSHEKIVNLIFDKCYRKAANKNSKGETFLMLIFDNILYEEGVPDAIKKVYIRIVKRLVTMTTFSNNKDYKIGINATNDEHIGDSPTVLYKAVRERDVRMVKILLQCDDIDVNVKEKGMSVDDEDTSLIWYAIVSDQKEIVEVLLDTKKVDVKIIETNGPGRSLLHMAINRGNKEIVELLVKYYEEQLSEEEAEEWLNKPSSREGYRPLSYAQQNNKKEIIKILEKSKYVDPKLPDEGIHNWLSNLWNGKRSKRNQSKRGGKDQNERGWSTLEKVAVGSLVLIIVVGVGYAIMQYFQKPARKQSSKLVRLR